MQERAPGTVTCQAPYAIRIRHVRRQVTKGFEAWHRVILSRLAGRMNEGARLSLTHCLLQDEERDHVAGHLEKEI